MGQALFGRFGIYQGTKQVKLSSLLEISYQLFRTVTAWLNKYIPTGSNTSNPTDSLFLIQFHSALNFLSPPDFLPLIFHTMEQKCNRWVEYGFLYVTPNLFFFLSVADSQNERVILSWSKEMFAPGLRTWSLQYRLQGAWISVTLAVTVLRIINTGEPSPLPTCARMGEPALGLFPIQAPSAPATLWPHKKVVTEQNMRLVNGPNSEDKIPDILAHWSPGSSIYSCGE